MPFIGTKVNVKVSKEQETQLKEELGRAIEIIPGKTEQWLMLELEDNCRMYFRGNQDSGMAFVEVKIYGKAEKRVLHELTGKICEIFEEVLGISSDSTYIKYEEVANWGWNGGNF